jgi:hypothetical protein
MEQTITVIPIPQGWRIKCSAGEPEVLFRSGAQAEAAAHSLATEIAKAGDTAVIQIFLRDGALGGRYVHAPKARDLTPGARAAGASIPDASPAR